MKKIKEILVIVLSVMGAVGTALISFFILSKSKSSEDINSELEIKKEEITKKYEREREDLISKPAKVTIEEYYAELDTTKDAEIQQAVDAAIAHAERYKKK